MRRTADLEIDGVRYTTTQYPATGGHKLLIRLAKVAGGPLVSVMSAGGLGADVTPDLIAKAIDSLMGAVDEDMVDKLVKDALATTEVMEDSGRKALIACFDIHFAGRYGHLYKVLKEVLAFQYGDFFGAIAGAGELLRREGKGAAIKAK